MKNIIYTITSFIILSFLFFNCGNKISAETRSYLVTSGFDTPYPDYTNGFVYFYKNISLFYNSGKVYLSSKPDGTGPVTIGDMMQVYDHYLGKKYTYQGYNSSCTVFNDVIPAQDITNIVYPSTYQGTADQGKNNLLVRLSHWCYRPKQIGALYIVVVEERPAPTSTPSPTPTPTPTATPTPSGPLPFLDLPWNYEEKGLSFNEALMAMSAYFDHEYPLLGGGAAEPEGAESSVVTYAGPIRTLEPYSSHDGYDYARAAKVLYGDKVLAAAAGTAKYVNSCRKCGNMILIDHGNGYQTRYMHLQKDGLLSTDSARLVPVSAGEVIGLVGSTGRSSGPHLHFSVYQDKDSDGKFDIPDGATDPMGWNSRETDPWETYTFDYFGSQKRGNKSYYLWKKPTAKIIEKIGMAGGTYQTERISVAVPRSAAPDLSELKLESAPAVMNYGNLRSVGSTFIVELRDPFGDFIRNFLQPLLITVDFRQFDLTGLDTNSLSLYSSNDGQVWQKEPTTIDQAGKKATAEVTHLTKFALMAERTDMTAPVTRVNIDGLMGEPGYYRSDMSVSFEVADNAGGLGVEKTLYSLDGEEWSEYTGPLQFTEAGDYEVQYYSWDKDGNQEEVGKTGFSIDKSAAELSISYDIEKEEIIITSSDAEAVRSASQAGANRQLIKFTDKAGNNVALVISNRNKGRQTVMNIWSISYNGESYPVDVSYSVLSEKLENGQIDKLTQKYSVKGEERLSAEYDPAAESTNILIREKNSVTKEVLNGIMLLNIGTNKGTMMYSY